MVAVDLQVKASDLGLRGRTVGPELFTGRHSPICLFRHSSILSCRLFALALEGIDEGLKDTEPIA